MDITQRLNQLTDVNGRVARQSERLANSDAVQQLAPSVVARLQRLAEGRGVVSLADLGAAGQIATAINREIERLNEQSTTLSEANSNLEAKKGQRFGQVRAAKSEVKARREGVEGSRWFGVVQDVFSAVTGGLELKVASTKLTERAVDNARAEFPVNKELNEQIAANTAVIAANNVRVEQLKKLQVQVARLDESVQEQAGLQRGAVMVETVREGVGIVREGLQALGNTAPARAIASPVQRFLGNVRAHLENLMGQFATLPPSQP